MKPTIVRERLGSHACPVWVHHEHEARWQFAAEMVAGKVVVDCASGVGKGSFLFGSLGAAHVHAFDLSDDAVQATAERCKTLLNVTVRQASGLSLPLESSSVDLFVSFETIEHIDDDRGFLEEVARVMKPEGIFLCSTPNRTTSMPGKTLADPPWNPYHVREYDQVEFAALLGAKFANIEMLGQNPRPAWQVGLLASLGKVLPGNLGGRLNSALKLPRFLYDRLGHHVVEAIPPGAAPEFLVAICRNVKV